MTLDPEIPTPTKAIFGLCDFLFSIIFTFLVFLN
jgi:type II secretory pathway component PulF